MSLGAGLLSWAAQFFGIWLTLARSASTDRSPRPPAVFLVSNLVGLVPVVPGNVGVFQLAVATSLSQAFGISYAAGITFGIGLQVIEVALGAGLGFVFLFAGGPLVRRGAARHRERRGGRRGAAASGAGGRGAALAARGLSRVQAARVTHVDSAGVVNYG